MQARHLIKYLMLLLTTLLSAALITGCGSSSESNKAPELLKIELSPIDIEIPNGIEKQCIATGIYSNNTTRDITDVVSWSSSKPEAVSVSDFGMVKGLISDDSASITATDSLSAISGSTLASVTDSVLMKIQISTETEILAAGTSKQYTATGIFSDNTTHGLTSQVSWQSDNETAATINDSGLLSGLAAGMVKVTAELNGNTAATTVEIKDCVLQEIAVTPLNASIPKGLSQAFIAMATFTSDEGATTHTQNVTDFASWSSDDPDIASVQAGIANTYTDSLKTGVVNITADFNGKADTRTLTVSEARLQSISITPVNTFVPLGNIVKFTATGIFTDQTGWDITQEVTWKTSDEAIVEISNTAGNKGEGSAIGLGRVSVTVTHESEFAGTTELTVTPAVLKAIEITADTGESTPAGTPVNFTATGIYTDNTTEIITDAVIWDVSNDDRATISNADSEKGMAITRQAGEVIVTATHGASSITGDMVFDISDAVLQEITLSPDPAVIATGFSQQLKATGLFTDGQHDITDSVNWISDNSDVGISNAPETKGLIITTVAATANISAEYTGAAPTIANLPLATGVARVVDAELVSIEIVPDLPSIPLGLTRQFSAIGTYDNVDVAPQDITQSVTWESSNTDSAEISNADGSRGLAATLGKAIGETTISVVSGEIASQTVLTVTDAELASIVVSRENEDLSQNFETIVGMTTQMKAMGIYTDESTLNITSEVLWETSDADKADISNAEGLEGTFTAKVAGDTTITATQGAGASAISGDTDATLKQITGIEICSCNSQDDISESLTIESEEIKAFCVQAAFSDDSTAYLTEGVFDWSSEVTDRLEIRNNLTGEFKGLLAGGVVSISVNYDVNGNGEFLFSATADLKITGEVLILDTGFADSIPDAWSLDPEENGWAWSEADGGAITVNETNDASIITDEIDLNNFSNIFLYCDAKQSPNDRMLISISTDNGVSWTDFPVENYELSYPDIPYHMDLSAFSDTHCRLRFRHTENGSNENYSFGNMIRQIKIIGDYL